MLGGLRCGRGGVRRGGRGGCNLQVALPPVPQGQASFGVEVLVEGQEGARSLAWVGSPGRAPEGTRPPMAAVPSRPVQTCEAPADSGRRA